MYIANGAKHPPLALTPYAVAVSAYGVSAVDSIRMEKNGCTRLGVGQQMADLQLHCVGLILPCTGTARACNLDKKQQAKQLLRSDPAALSPTASITLWCQNPIKGRATKTEGDHRFGSGCTGWERYCKELFAGYEEEVISIL